MCDASLMALSQARQSRATERRKGTDQPRV